MGLWLVVVANLIFLPSRNYEGLIIPPLFFLRYGDVFDSLYYISYSGKVVKVKNLKKS